MQRLRRVALGVALGGVVLASLSAGAAYPPARNGSSAGVVIPGDLVDLNTATPAELAALPGMGAAYARRVVEGRPYSAKNQLVTRGVLPNNAYQAIKDRVVAHRPAKR